MSTKPSSGNSRNWQLQQKLATLSKRIDELEDTSKIRHRNKEELQEWQDMKIGSESRRSSLTSEVEELTKRVRQIEGKDEEIMKIEKQCQDLTERLEIECTKSSTLRAEVNTLNCRIMELEKLEDAFNKSKQECCLFKSSLEKERSMSKNLSNELDSLRVRIKELEAAEGQLEKVELSLKEELTKLKALTVIMMDERKSMIEKMKQMEDKLEKNLGKRQGEQHRDVFLAEKLTEENQKALKSNAELEKKMQNALRDRDEVRVKLKAEEERSNELKSKVNIMKKRIQSLEALEREFVKNNPKEENIKSTSSLFHQEDNKVKDLTQEVEILRNKLKDMKSIEANLLKSKGEFESLQNKYLNEQKRAKRLMEELETTRMEISKFHIAEKKEFNQEHMLYKRLKEEEAKSGNLTKQLEDLKEKLHKLTGTEESICRLKMDYSILQKKLTQQESKNKELARDMEDLTEELDTYQHFSKSHLLKQNQTNISDIHVSSKEVQTVAENEVELAMPSTNLCKRGEDDMKHNNEFPFIKCRASLINNASSLNENFKQPRISGPKCKENAVLNSKVLKNGNYVQQGDVILTHSPGKPLHIKVTPDHGKNTAMLEITSPTSENSHSYTSTAIIPTNCTSPKQRITIIQNTSKAKGSSSTESLCSPDPPMSPLSMLTYSRSMTNSDSSGSLTPERAMSPIQIVSVTAGSPEYSQSTEFVEVMGSHTVFRVAKERQSWQLQSSSGPGSNITTTEDNKIHIHLGNPYIQAVNSISQPISPCCPSENIHLSPTLFSGNSAKVDSKMTSSITITPNVSPISRPSHITISKVYD